MTVTVRPVTAADEAQWRARWEKYNIFYKRTVPENVTANTWRRFLDDKIPSYAAVAVDDAKPEGDNIIGFVTFLPHMFTGSIEDQVYLGDLYVDDEARNGGAGRKLIEYVYDWARQHDIYSVYWHTQHFNHRAQLLYTKVADKTDFVQYGKSIKGEKK
ncbi:D-amino-acid N-acetyltransferase HPA3 [Vanrija pseudolonga]|uniref:D-amino-acid N-acetyltransferase HPA3 n=1 Tax=Vanrija pseudolonga TaxID=143232 RepID=A0AAF0XZW0_9TREE|nr:D-amino-acid N-acetyltransferase HPA3 [Vanrija pseudolonga]